MRIVLLGPPGAGKSTKAEAIARRFDIPRVSPATSCGRIYAKARSGVTAETDMVKGSLVPDNLVARLIEEHLNKPDARKGFVLKAFPGRCRRQRR